MRYALNNCSVTETFDPHNYVFTGPCHNCKKEVSVVVKSEELWAYRRGAHIQEALSNNSDEREFLISGICPKCWETVFSTDD